MKFGPSEAAVIPLKALDMTRVLVKKKTRCDAELRGETRQKKGEKMHVPARVSWNTPLVSNPIAPTSRRFTGFDGSDGQYRRFDRLRVDHGKPPVPQKEKTFLVLRTYR